ncbi:MAG: hypothetical protein JSU82_13805 [Rhodospirillales bacterium]|nr:MAG: hypothetical protein JSU82_13805 [Rhodospirillales bacterium]
MYNYFRWKAGGAGKCLRSLIVAGTAVLAICLVTSLVLEGQSWAAQSGEVSKGAMWRKGGDGGGKAGGRGQMRQGGGSTLEQRILREDLTEDDDGDESDRPEWAGREGDRDLTPGGGNEGGDRMKGDIYGDLYVILRDANGVPMLTDEGYVQPIAFKVDADGNLVPVLDENGDYVLLPLDDEGEIDPSQIPPGENWVAAEVEFSRLSIARSPEKVTDRALQEAYLALLEADSVTLDPGGRIVVMIDGEESTFDSPLINLALYQDLLNYGNLILRDADGDPILDENGNVQPLLPSSILPEFSTALTKPDLELAASLFAAAADKTSVVTVDMVVYMNSILGIDGTLPDDYVDFSTFTYNRASAFAGVTATVLVQQPDGSYAVEEVSILDAVFGGEDGSFDPATENVNAAKVDGFTAASDDALQVLEFIHTYAPPEEVTPAI